MSESLFNRKSIFAKLLARENIHVVLDKVETASFDVLNRVLRIPYWEEMTPDMYDMFVAHEVSHALHTPTEGWFEFLESGYRDQPKGLLQSYLNIVEDVRIERIMCVRFPGLEKKFILGWGQLLEKGMWGDVKGKIQHMGFMDRLNTKAKFREHIVVPFSDKEQVFVDKAHKIETFQEAIDLAKELIDFEIENRKPINTVLLEHFQNMDGFFEDEDEDEDIDRTKRDAKDDYQGKVDLDGESSDEDTDEDEDEDEDGSSPGIDVFVDSLDGDHSDDEDEGEDALPIPGTPHIANIWIKNTVMGDKNVTFDLVNSNTLKSAISFDDAEHNIEGRKSKNYSIPYDAYVKWQKRNKKYYMALVRDFERKRAARSYARAKTHVTGSIDTKKLHEYKFNDKIFKTVLEMANGQSHGMVMLIDFSGSMFNTISKVLDQTLILINFCKRVGIPYSVHYFTSSSNFKYDTNNEAFSTGTPMKMDKLRFVELTSSTMPKKKRLASEARMLNVDRSDQMGGTPLFNSLSLASKIAKDMKMRHKLDKVSVVALTDGDGDLPNEFYGIKPENTRLMFDGDIIPKAKDNRSKNRSYTNHAHEYTNALIDYCTEKYGFTYVNFHVVRGIHDSLSVHRVLGRSLLDSEEREFSKDGVLSFDYQPISRYKFKKTIILVNNHDNGSYKVNKEIKSTSSGNVFLRNLAKGSKTNKIIAKNFVEAIA